jgi:long-chain acyl-CoA synthetase
MDDKSIQYILDQSQPKAIFADSTTLPVVARLMQKGNTGIKAIIYAGQDWEVSDNIKKLEGVQDRNFELVHIDELKRAKGGDISGKGKTKASSDSDAAEDETEESVKIETAYPEAGDVACIMYTSGSTGTPKGAQLTHGNLMSAIGSAAAMEGNLLNKDEDIIISYLPLAHVLEFVISHFIVSMVGLCFTNQSSSCTTFPRNHHLTTLFFLYFFLVSRAVVLDLHVLGHCWMML